MNDNAKDWAKYGTYITGSILFIAIIRLSIIGNRFGIPIGGFINFPNLIAFTAKILHPLSYLAIGTLIVFLGCNMLEPIIIRKLEKIPSIGINILMGIILCLDLLFFVKLVVKAYYLYYHIDGDLHNQRSLLVAGFIALAIIYVFLKFCFNKSNQQLLFGTLLFCYLFFFAKAEAKNEVYLITCEKVSKGTRIIFNSGDSLVSDSSRYFIASTLDFVFFYNEKDQQTLVYPQRDVKKIVFSSAVLPR